MADNKTTFLEDAIINHVLRNTPYTSPTGIEIGLFTVSPTESGGGTEVTGTNYARQAVTWSAPVNGATANAGAITFPIAGSNWGTVTSIALFDAVSGDMLYYGDMATPKTIDTGDQITFPAGALTLTEQ